MSINAVLCQKVHRIGPNIYSGVTVFQGKSSLNLDGKGRLTMPAKFREFLDGQDQGQVTVTLHPDGCLLIFPRAEWLKFRENIAALPMTVQWWKRKFIGSATDVEVDGAGRILISPELREAINLPKEVLMVGMLNHIEVWDKAVYLAKEAQETQGPMPASLQNFSY